MKHNWSSLKKFTNGPREANQRNNWNKILIMGTENQDPLLQAPEPDHIQPILALFRVIKNW